MAKQIIHLKESELKNYLTEALKKVILSEANWKTYTNAARKAGEQGDISYWRDHGVTDPKTQFNKAVNGKYRADRFAQAAQDSFNDEYGYQNGNMWDNGYNGVRMGGDFDAIEEFGPNIIGLKNKGYGNLAKYEYGINNYTGEKQTPEEFFDGNDDAAQAYKKGEEDIKNYRQGKSKYIPGKGWINN